MAEQAKAELLTLIRKYRELDSSIKKINKNLTDLRDERGELEHSMEQIFAKPEFQHFQKMDLSDDSYIRIQRPGEWKKPWGLSKKELGVLLTEFFGSGKPLNAESCYQHIVEAREKTLVASEMNFSRIERQ